jgi:hypothetical protein
MKSKLWVPVLLAVATFSASAFAHNWEHDGWRHDQWREHRHHRHHAHLPPPPPPVVWRHEHPRPYAYRDGGYYDRSATYREVPVLAPPAPLEVHRAVRNSLFGH